MKRPSGPVTLRAWASKKSSGLRPRSWAHSFAPTEHVPKPSMPGVGVDAQQAVVGLGAVIVPVGVLADVLGPGHLQLEADHAGDLDVAGSVLGPRRPPEIKPLCRCRQGIRVDS